MFLLLPIGFLMGVIFMLDDEFNWVSWALDEVERKEGKYAAWVAAMEIMTW